MDVPPRYWAFLSYSHADRRMAERLHRALEGYRIPRRLVGRSGPQGPVPARLYPVFRDRDELDARGEIGSVVEAALAASRTLVVLCSPKSARSQWVEAEIEAFRRLHPDAPVLCVLLDGEPLAAVEAARECLGPTLRARFGQGVGTADRAPVAVDLRANGDGWRLGLQKLVAGIAGVPLGELVQRDAQRRHRRMAWLAAVLAAIAVGFGALASVALVARNDAQRRQAQAEDLLGFMLGDLRDKLQKVGRLDLLDSVGDKAMAYFDSLDPRDLNDRTLAWQEQALTQLGQVRLNQNRYPEAQASFERAYARSRALVDRHPGGGSLLFDRGQAEYWIGFVYWQRRDLDRAQLWLTRYRDTCRAVHAIDPNKVEWLHELAYGDANLATVELERGRLHDAGGGFRRAYATLQAVRAKTPDDPQVAYDMADNLSWQGNVEEQLGHLDRAEAFLARTVGGVRRIAAGQPKDPNWKYQLANVELLLSALQGARGLHVQSEATAAAALARMQALAAFDPGNKEWRRAYLRALVLHARARLGQSRFEEARADLARAQPLLDASADVEGSDRLVRREMLDAFTLRGLLALHDGDRDAANAAASQLRKLFGAGERPDSAEETGRYALGQLIIAAASAGDGRDGDAASNFAAAREALQPFVGDSRYWRVLDPWVRVSLLTGNPDAAAQAQARLAGEGYVPLFPWPTTAIASRIGRASSFTGKAAAANAPGEP
ncbi:MAG: TIR domain-containing protein [Lysobacter sp.]|nr:TIR domain-containing protein [Lysobacter sp.]